MVANEKNNFKFSLKFFWVLVLCLLARLIPLRMPNIEPIMATMMPLSRAYGAFIGSSFAFSSILLYDTLTGTLGMQTFFTAGAYGMLGLWATYYFKKRQGNTMDYVTFAILGTLLFDSFTGLTVGPIFFHQSFLGSLVGQIPFTALHLLGNIAFAFILSPAVYKFLIKKRKEKILPHINLLNPKTI